ncbi:MAG: ABC transporter substrate-binding protein [Chloroflexi bacterium]|nr:ABC transporter substrate-binding protein [Chloroflexota bacterium]
MKKLFTILLSCLLISSLAFSLVACDDKKGQTPTEPITLTDDTGETFTFDRDKLPNKVVSLSPGVTECLYAMGLEDLIVGCTTFCDYPAPANDKFKVGGSTSADVEKIMQALQGDKERGIILISNSSLNKPATQMRELGYMVFLTNPTTFESLFDCMRTYNTILGGTDYNRVESVIVAMEARVKAVTDRLPASTPKVTVLHVMYGGLMIAGAGTRESTIINLALGINLGDTFGSGYITPNVESFIAANPTLIIVVTDHGTGYGYMSDVTNDSRLAGMSAVKNGNVIEIESNSCSRPGPRLIDALENYAQILHPDIFGTYQYDPNQYV